MSELKTKLLHIPVAQIRENPVALRAVNRQSADYQSLANSIAKDGILNPILVREISSGDDGVQLYGIIDGLHRYTGALDAGLKSVPAQVVNMEDADVMEKQLIGNAQRVETKPVEYSRHLQRILAANATLTMNELAGRLNKSGTWLSERLGILKLSPKIAGLVDDGKINLSNAYVLAKLPEEEQEAFVDRAQTMSPTQFTPTVLARKKEIETAKRQGRDTKPAEFTPVPHIQKLVALKSEMDNPVIGPILVRENKLTTPEEGFAMGVRWALNMDPRSIEAEREKDAARKKSLEEKKTKAAAERAQKKAAEAAEVAAKLAV